MNNNKRKSLDDESKENQDPTTPSQKKSKLDLFDEKLNSCVQKLNQFENQFEKITDKISRFLDANTEVNQEESNVLGVENQNVAVSVPQTSKEPNELDDDQEKEEISAAQTKPEPNHVDELMDILNRSKLFNSYIKDGKVVAQPGQSICMNLFDVIQMSDFFNNEDLVSKLKSYISSLYNPDSMRQVFEELMMRLRYKIDREDDLNQISRLKSTRIILDLIDDRLKWIDNIQTEMVEPQFSLRMPVSNITQSNGYYHDKDFIKFLKIFLESEQQSINYRCGMGINYARSLEHQFGGLKENYSISIKPNGSGQNACVHIQKTSELFNKKRYALIEKKMRLNEEKRNLNNFVDFYNRKIQEANQLNENTDQVTSQNGQQAAFEDESNAESSEETNSSDDFSVDQFDESDQNANDDQNEAALILDVVNSIVERVCKEIDNQLIQAKLNNDEEANQVNNIKEVVNQSKSDYLDENNNLVRFVKAEPIEPLNGTNNSNA